MSFCRILSVAAMTDDRGTHETPDVDQAASHYNRPRNDNARYVLDGDESDAQPGNCLGSGAIHRDASYARRVNGADRGTSCTTG